ncbi:MAG TPA: ATP-binding protein, partial [Acidimicrobiales bacterium]|nr:ATP-binding protein [Acidimicrobiales bacterium]
VRVSRARGSTAFPARFILIGAMNPCPCGEGGAPGMCVCSEAARERYGRRLSAPLLDRFDIAIRIDRPDVDDLLGSIPGESTAEVAGRVLAARGRAAGRHVRVNAELPGATLQRDVPMTKDASKLLESRMRSGTLSARGFHRVHRIARTIADLEGSDDVTDLHVQEALLLRCRRDLLLGKERR